MNRSHWQYKSFNSLVTQPVTDISKRAGGSLSVDADDPLI